MTARRVVVVGNGMAGARLIADVRRRDPAGDRVQLTALGAEPDPAYNRVLLSALLARTTAEAALALASPDPVVGLDLRLSTPAVRIDRTTQTVRDAAGDRHRYDELVLATGSTAWVPPVPGLRSASGQLVTGAVTFRTLADCRRIDAAASAGSRVAVLGGGLLGVEAARALAGRGVAVTLLHPEDRLMERQLDGGAGALVAETLGRLGVDVRLQRGVTQVCSREGRLTALLLKDGEVLPTELLVVATGVRPQVQLGRAAGLAVGRGLLVDDELRSVSDPKIRALGECAEHAGQLTGLVAPAWQQAEVLADLLTGARPTARYRGSRTVTRLKADDVDLVAVGEWTGDREPDSAAGAEVLQFSDQSRGVYKKLVVHSGRLVGAIVLGDGQAGSRLIQLYDSDDPVPVDRTSLLFGPRSTDRGQVDPALLPDRALVCTCNTVSKGDVLARWQRGDRDLAQIAASTRATTGCGTCRDTVQGLLSWLHQLPTDPAAVRPPPRCHRCPTLVGQSAGPMRTGDQP